MHIHLIFEFIDRSDVRGGQSLLEQQQFSRSKRDIHAESSRESRSQHFYRYVAPQLRIGGTPDLADTASPSSSTTSKSPSFVPAVSALMENTGALSRKELAS